MTCRASGWSLLVLFATLCSVNACKIFESTCDENDRSCFGGGLVRRGEACIRTGDCASGMACRGGECEYAANTKRGGKCVVTAECVAGTYCSSELRCTELAKDLGKAGDACGDSSECGTGLVCDLDLADALNTGPFAKLSEACRAKVSQLKTASECQLPKTCATRGTRDFNDACTNNAQCMPGLYCAPSPLAEKFEPMCLGGVEFPEELLSVPAWGGVLCPPDAESPTSYFELSAGYNAASDFYRLPFPNDIRRFDTGEIDLTGHPAPPDDLEPPVASRFVKDAAKQHGFSTNPVVYFRFSEPYATSSLSLSSVRIVDITPDSPDYNTNSTISWGPPERDSHYICAHWLSLHRPPGSPLRPNTTYAAVVTRKLKTKEDRDYERSPDFDAMLSDTPPAGMAMRLAWETYEPLRAWVADDGAAFDADDLLNAAVFTTGDPTAIMPQLKAAVAAEGGPGLKSLTVCKAGVTSPCEDATGRGACHAEQPEFIEIHGKLTLPIFQSGTPPYEQPENGGGIEPTGDRVRAVRNEDVCFSLSVPVSAAPASGYPLLIYAYAVGGVFQEVMGEGGLAAEVARGSAPAALLSIELPQHGARRGSSQRPPEDLFVNFQNPAALRGNVLQGAADLWGAIALAKVGILARPVDGQPLHFDPKRLVLFAQGQGATHAAIALAGDDALRAVVLAEVPGHFGLTQLQRTKPASMAALLPLMLIDLDKDGRLAGGIVNPMLSLIQSAVDSVDPINYANRLFRIDEDAGRDAFVVYGREDHFSPDAAQEAFAKAAHLAAVTPDLSAHFDDLDPPVTRNQRIGMDRRTVALRQYDPSLDPTVTGMPEDGHFVVQATQAAHADVIRFLTQALAGEPPTIGEQSSPE